MTRLIVFFSFLLVACSDEGGQTSTQYADSSPQADNPTIQKHDTTIFPMSKIHLPRKKRTIKDIDEIVSGINDSIEKGEWEMERIYGVNNEPCEIVRYYKDSILLQITRGCGDCSNIISSDKYYFKDNSLIYLKTHVVDYGYNPCWSDKDCKELGVTEKFKKENLRERNDKYYFLDSSDLALRRTGNLNDATYLKNDTLSQTAILEEAIEYLNAREPN